MKRKESTVPVASECMFRFESKLITEVKRVCVCVCVCVFVLVGGVLVVVVVLLFWVVGLLLLLGICCRLLQFCVFYCITGVLE